MLIRRFILIVALCLPLFTLAIGNVPSAKELEKEYRQFLMNLGFEDYSHQIKANRKKDTGLGAASKDVLKFNQDRYEVVNYSRELAVKLLTQLELSKDDPEMRKNIVTFTTKMLQLKPMSGPSRYPDKIMSLTNDEEREEAKKEFLIDYTMKRMETHAALVGSDVLETLYGNENVAKTLDRLKTGKSLPKEVQAEMKNAKQAEQLATKIVFFMYLDSELSQTPFLGKALAAGIVRFSQKVGHPEMVDSLRRELFSRGLYLDNFVGDTLVIPGKLERSYSQALLSGAKALIGIPDREASVHRVQIKNGDFIHERSREREAWEISFAARNENWLAERNHRLSGTALGLLGVPASEPPKPQEATNWDVIKYHLGTTPYFTKGFSHVGMATVKQDPRSGIRMVWALDNYPNAGEGGIRLSDITSQFAKRGPYMRFGLSRFDPKKFYEIAQKQIKERGYKKRAWVGEEETNDDSPSKKPKKAYWPTLISESEFKALHDIGKRDPERWYDEVMKRITDHIRNNMLAKDGVGFAYGFSNFKGRAYCSQTLVIAGLQAVGLDLQEFPDHWHLLARVLKDLGVEAAKDLRTDLRIVAPSGFFTQPAVGESLQITYDPMTLTEQAQSMTVPTYVPMSKQNAKRLKNHPEFQKLVEKELEVPAEELTAAIERAIEGEYRKQEERTHPGIQRASAVPRNEGYLGSTFHSLGDSRRQKKAAGK